MDPNGDPGVSLRVLEGAWGALGGSRRFSGHGFNRALSFDSNAQVLFLLISLPFYRFSSYMDSNQDSGGSLGALRVLEGLQQIFRPWI